MNILKNSDKYTTLLLERIITLYMFMNDDYSLTFIISKTFLYYLNQNYTINTEDYILGYIVILQLFIC